MVLTYFFLSLLNCFKLPRVYDAGSSSDGKWYNSELTDSANHPQTWMDSVNTATNHIKTAEDVGHQLNHSRLNSKALPAGHLASMCCWELCDQSSPLLSCWLGIIPLEGCTLSFITGFWLDKWRSSQADNHFPEMSHFLSFVNLVFPLISPLIPPKDWLSVVVG